MVFPAKDSIYCSIFSRDNINQIHEASLYFIENFNANMGSNTSKMLVAKSETKDWPQYLTPLLNRWVERILPVKQTCRIKSIPMFSILVDAIGSYFKEQKLDFGWLST